MTDWLLALVPQYGLWLLAVTTLLSCLALPLPASILMLSAGGFAASDDLILWQVVGAALAGAIAGDQIGYWGGRVGGAALIKRMQSTPKMRQAVAKMNNMGLTTVFLTRWLFSAVGPWINIAAGAARSGWVGFTFAGVAGELVWVGIYTGLGYGFAGNIEAASEMLGSVLGLLAAGAVMVALGLWLFALMRQGDGRPDGDHQ